MAHDCTREVDSILQMSQAALSVKNTALDTLATELDQLKMENQLLVQLATEKGGNQVPQLIRSLQQAQLESQQLSQRLQQEVELREDLERELEDTAAAAQELWESMQAVYSDAADSRTHSMPGSPTPDREQWGTPPEAVSPVTGLTATGRAPQQQHPSIAEAAAAALASQAAAAAASDQRPSSEGNEGARSPILHRALSRQAISALEAAGEAPSPAMHGILTPLENKLQSLSNKLVGLVSWLDARDSSTPGSTPRGATPPSAAVTPTGSVNSGSKGTLGFITPLSFSSVSPGRRDNQASLQQRQQGGSASPESVKGGRAGGNSSARSRLSPQKLRAAAAAASAGLGKGHKAAAAAGLEQDDVRVKDSSPAR